LSNSQDKSLYYSLLITAEQHALIQRMLDFEARMLSGEPFTIEDLKHRFSSDEGEAQKIDVQSANFTGSVL
jgi:hypothetical protein